MCVCGPLFCRNMTIGLEWAIFFDVKKVVYKEHHNEAKVTSSFLYVLFT